MILLDTKISIPQLPSPLISRPRLLNTLDRAFQCRLTLVSAPAGSGKTTLLSEWVARSGRRMRVVWISLGETENEPYRFWHYFIAALESLLGKNLSDRLNWNMPPTNNDLETLIAIIVHEIPNDFFLVLDDYHVITSAPIHKALTYLLNYLPPHMHLIITSRVQIPLAVSQLRVRGQLLECTQADLKFNQDETLMFMRKMVAAELSIDDIVQLNKKAEGWATGLQLAALSVQSQSQTVAHDLLSSFSGMQRSMAAYFTEQVFDRLPEVVRYFLMTTSILDKFDAALCNTVTEGNDARGMLEWLEQNNLLLTMPDRRDIQWYRYHPLFTDFLREKLQRDHSDLLPILHGRAARWLKENNFIEAAVEHALHAKDYDLAACLIQHAEAGVRARNDLGTLQRWFTTLPVEHINACPDLCVGMAWTSLDGNMNKLPLYLDQLDNYHMGGNISAQTPWQFSANHYLANAEILRGYSAFCHGNMENARRHYKQALQRSPEDGTCLEQSLAAFYLGDAMFWNGEDLVECQKLISNAGKIAQNYGQHSYYLEAISTLAYLNTLQGKLSGAEFYFRRCEQYVNELEVPVLMGRYFAGLGDLYRERNDLKTAASLIKQGVELAEAGNSMRDMCTAYFTQARLEQALGNLNEAQVLFHKSYQIASRGELFTLREIAGAWQARIWLDQNNLAAADHWAKTIQMNLETTPQILAAIQETVLVRVLLAEKQVEAALDLLKRLLAAAEAGGWLGIVIEILILMALAYQANRETGKAFECIQRALTLAKPETYTRIFVDEGDAVESLLKLMFQRDKIFFADTSMREYVSLVLKAFGKRGSCKISAERVKKSAQPLIEPLSNRELQVLQLIALGKSYEQVAQELVVALSTVQWHIKNIYQKLNVHSGMEAVVTARELQILF